jgi:SPX domain protein involved in polyphosphate accumulation
MRFGINFIKYQKEEWKSVYLEYNLLKKILENLKVSIEQDEDDQTELDRKFMQQFNYESEKIKSFVVSTNIEIKNKISKIVRDLKKQELFIKKQKEENNKNKNLGKNNKI